MKRRFRAYFKQVTTYLYHRKSMVKPDVDNSETSGNGTGEIAKLTNC